MADKLIVNVGDDLNAIYKRADQPKGRPVKVHVERILKNRFNQPYLLVTPKQGMEASTRTGMVALPASAFLAQGLTVTTSSEPVADLEGVVVFLGAVPKSFQQVDKPGAMAPSALVAGGVWAHDKTVTLESLAMSALPAMTE